MRKGNGSLSITVVTIFMIAIFSASLFAAEEVSGDVIAGNLAEEADEYLEAATELERFSGSVLIARGEEVIFKRSYGMADREHDVANTPKVKYRLGSVTKQFTAMGILQLYEDGKLKLSDPVTDYIPGYEDSRGITIFHLLTHSSGLAEYTAFEGVGDRTKLPTTKNEIIDSFWNKELRFSPGEKFSYCNSNYVLLGRIIEKASGQSYEKYIEKNIFSPLGMKDSGYDHPEIVLEDRAEGYVNIGGEIMNASYIDPSFPSAAGALYSTVDDLHEWYLALTSGEVVDRTLWEEASSAQVDNYGYGFMEGNLYGYRRIYHGGTVNGFKTMINIFPDPDLTVIVLSNLETAEIERINRDLSAIAFREEYEVPQPEEFIEIDGEILESYTGKYAAGNGYTVEVSREQGHLILSLMGQPKLEVFPLSETEFSPKGSGLVVEFKPGVDGNVSGMKVTQERRSLEAEKVN